MFFKKKEKENNYLKFISQEIPISFEEDYIVNNPSDGEKLAHFLNFIKGFKNLENTILKKEDEIKNLQDEVIYLNEAKKITEQYV